MIFDIFATLKLQAIEMIGRQITFVVVVVIGFFLTTFATQNSRASVAQKSEVGVQGKVSIYFFYFNEIRNDVEIEITQIESSDDAIKQSVAFKDGLYQTNLNPGEYKLRYKFKDKLSRYENFKILSKEETQIIVSYDDYEFHVKVEHPKTWSKPISKDLDHSKKEMDSTLPASTKATSQTANAEETNIESDEIRSSAKLSNTVSNNMKSIIIRGQVFDKSLNKAISDANILVSGKDISAVTNSNGQFEIQGLSSDEASDSIELAIVHQSYVTATETLKWPIKSNNFKFYLQPSGLALDQITVVAPHVKGSVSSMMNQRKSSMSVKDLLGSEQMTKSGDTSAASALRRVTGLSLVDGKFIYVRGLGERYSTTLLNGSVLPSPDPSRRVVPLDMFPSALIESIEVQKTYSSDQISEFGGGVVNITTKSIPDQAFFRMNVSTGISSEGVLSGKDQGLFHTGSGSDWTGFDQKNIRALPQPIKNVIAQNRDINNVIDESPFGNDGSGFTGEEIEALGESFSRSYDIKEESLPANFGMTLELGDQYKRGRNFKIGGTAKLAYANMTDTDLITQRRVDMVSRSEGVVGIEDSNTETENVINFGGIFGLGIELFKNNQINVTQVLTRSTLNSTVAIERDGKNNVDDTANIYRLRWQERELRTSQVSGTHKFTSSEQGPKLIWSFTNSQALLDEPDFREYYYLKINDRFLFADDKAYGNQRSFSELNEALNDFKINYESQARLKTSATAFMDVGFKAGFQNIKKNREFDVRRFKFRNESTSGSSVNYDRTDSLNEIQSNANIRPGGFRLIDSTMPTDNYFADQDVNAVYVQASNTFNFKYNTKNGHDYFKPQFVYGLRLERSSQNVNTFDLNSSSSAAIATSLETSDLLPSLGLNFALSSKHTLRFGFTKTVSRPDFKELSPARFLNDDDNIYEVGNPDLVAASITNFDFRWDWYPSSKELISIGLFSKNFENPIEAYAVNSTDSIRSYRNINEANNAGIEFEIRKDITEFIGAGFNTEIFSNYSLITSQVKLSAEEKGDSTTFERPLQGQSPYLLNFGVDMSLPWYKFNTTLVYNIVGPRITDVGDGGRPDTYEEPIHQLDLSMIQKIKKNLNLTFRAQNLLDPQVTRTQGDFIVSSFQRGRAFSLGLSAVF